MTSQNSNRASFLANRTSTSMTRDASPASTPHANGAKVQHYKTRNEDCGHCALRHRCLKNPTSGKGLQVTKFGRALAV